MLKQFINDALKTNVTRIRVYDSSEEFWRKVNRKTPTLVIFDIRDANPKQLYNIKKVRKHSLLTFRRAPILAVADAISEQKIIEVLDTGADDVLVSPFTPEMLLARLEAIGRRAERQTLNLTEKKLKFNGLVIDRVKNRVFVKDEKVSLTPTEYDILVALFVRKDQVVTKKELILSVWGYEETLSSMSINTHLLNLRRKLGPTGGRIQTVRGRGYVFSTEKL